MSDPLLYDVSIVLPCFREEGSITEGTAKIFGVMRNTSYSFELIFVDDASPDNTREQILKAATAYPNVSYLFQSQNTGRGRAFSNGAMQAKGRIIGYLDIDLEISISSLPEVIREIENGNDIAIVKRNHASSGFSVRNFASIVYRRIVQSLLNMPDLDTETGFKFFRREALFSLLERTESPRWFFDTEIMCLSYYSGLHIAQVEGTYTKNAKKVSTVHLIPDSIRQFRQVLAFRKKLKRMFP